MKKIKKFLKNKKREIVYLDKDFKIEEDSETYFKENNFYDLTQLIIVNGGRIEFYAGILIKLFNICIALDIGFNINFVVDKRYSNDLLDNLYYYIDNIENLEAYIGLRENNVSNVVDIDKCKFEEMKKFISENLFGNKKFQERLFEELQKYRLFNKIGEQKIFSVFICGDSGIGKTETARILHKFLSPNEKIIKINFGNYGDKNALSSLIGSPRGYEGSNKGELSDKINKSKSKVILIDEFEKADSQIYNFFLELLEDGKFTDSLGREFNLDKYIIIFTSNIKKEEISKKISPELKSRFNLMYKFSLISNQDKSNYVNCRIDDLFDKFKKKLNFNFNNEQIERIKDINVSQYTNIRKINQEIMRRISNEYLKGEVQ
ncbi:AAA family ATPase [Clostridium sp. BJN0001]|uniref:AAA family ATPase n=1 Tax=Clostridium sp. BJN0001 TaxID=2930219 RepID=UPI001FD3BE98|nr:AAA family ATPase [Clostridium sp. BJN0001]